MIHSSQVREHMEVVGSDGKHVGRVDHVIGDQIELAKFDLGAGMKHHMIPIAWVEREDDGKLCLTITEDEAKSRWIEKN
jgi:hypothetical protein